MKIYAITTGDASFNEIIALTINKKRAEHIANLFEYAEVEEYNDAQDEVFPQNPLWSYCLYNNIKEKCQKIDPRGNKEKVSKIGRENYILYEVWVFAEDEARARKKAQDMIAQYKADKEGIT